VLDILCPHLLLLSCINCTLFERSSLAIVDSIRFISLTSFRVFYFVGSHQASVAVLQTWKDGVVKTCHSLKRAVEVEVEKRVQCIATLQHLLSFEEPIERGAVGS
jgi:hypothetical protein